jgi:hypothetical protein
VFLVEESTGEVRTVGVPRVEAPTVDIDKLRRKEFTLLN